MDITPVAFLDMQKKLQDVIKKNICSVFFFVENATILPRKQDGYHWGCTTAFSYHWSDKGYCQECQSYMNIHHCFGNTGLAGMLAPWGIITEEMSSIPRT
ncbi:hypothetical protein ATANTOWER_024357 [Ataeniobius toweri]|uniref:Uncharacterized protein n=1 Tax=Ataeniobius toweri TaxID=208326 RepID=A0ABU7BHE1_9TELE|nr:hypothetical protein [Ataeniobius toweri]